MIWSLLCLCISLKLVVAQSGARYAAYAKQRIIDACPERCEVSGPNPGNWSVYPDFKQIKHCKETMFYDLSWYDNVDDETESHYINVCSSFGPDFSNFPERIHKNIADPQSRNASFQFGWWNDEDGASLSALSYPSLRSVITQLRKYMDKGHGATTRPFTIFGQSDQTTIGLYIGQGLLNQGISNSALRIFEDNLDTLNVSAPAMGMQLCGPEHDSAHAFGIMATSNGTFGALQDAIKTWAKATCLSFSASINFTGEAIFTTPITTINTIITNSTTIATNLTKLGIRPRAECTTIQVESGDGCARLANKCGITMQELTRYNPASDFCTISNPKPKQHICCSSGSLPDFSPTPQADGSCYAYEVQADDNCADLAVQYSLTRDQLDEYNQNTWGWSKCDPLFKGAIICLSEGKPPFPAPIANAVCGPQKPGSKPPTDGTKITELNPCALNACCNIWGQCGITKDFCVDTNTGAPGTAKKDTHGCISNCGMDIVRGTGTGAYKIAYFQGYGMNRECLLQDASQIDKSRYTHIHFAFGTLTSQYQVETGNTLSTYQFSAFKNLKDIKRILSIGGWDFSTLPTTYSIFRDGVTSANRLTMATSIAEFVIHHDLDGVDIDWEYPGAPDIPGIPAGSLTEGTDYLAFLVVLKNLLPPGKSLSICAPSSYWYLRQYPIKDIAKVVDYIVYMSYDLHGQWDTGNAFSQEGCDTGNCLRSQVNLTETRSSLAMVTKAGVPGHKVIVGVTSYGRSFNMAESGCWGPQCLYTGSARYSDATAGRCTAVSGYIADAEIEELLSSSKRDARVVTSYLDVSSNSDILVYDNTQWVSYMSKDTKKTRTALYSAWGLGGTTDWASDLQTFHEVPKPASSWSSFKGLVQKGQDPLADQTRNGNWTELDCTSDYIAWFTNYSPSEIWNGLNADAAWKDVVRIWKDTDSKRDLTFTKSVGQTLHMGTSASKCHLLAYSGCDNPSECTAGLDSNISGPAGMLIWNSMVKLHNLFSEYHDTLFEVAGPVIGMLKDLGNKFAPVDPPKDHTWDFFLIDLVTLGTLSIAAPFFNGAFRALPYFATDTKAGSSALDNAKDLSLTLIGQSTTIAKDLLSLGDPDDSWKPENHDAFSSYMSNTINAWGNVTEDAVAKLFDGSDESLNILEQAMSDGKLGDGRIDGTPGTNMTKKVLRNHIMKSIFAYAIPALWEVSHAYPFIMETGYACNTINPLGDYLDDETQLATGACVQDKLYYLASAQGDARICECERQEKGPCSTRCRRQKFAAPKGIQYLDGNEFGGITRETLIEGSVKTWLANGKKNPANRMETADITDQVTITNLMNLDLTTPGLVRIPICSPERAFKAWDTSSKGSKPNYPCDLPDGKKHCGKSISEDQTSNASPSVSDCGQIIRNIEEDASTDWTTQVVGKNQRKITSYGSCAFGVEATKVDGNVEFYVGGQDVIDMIREAIDRFSNHGKVGAKGIFSCKANTNSAQEVKWGLY